MAPRSTMARRAASAHGVSREPGAAQSISPDTRRSDDVLLLRALGALARSAVARTRFIMRLLRSTTYEPVASECGSCLHGRSRWRRPRTQQQRSRVRATQAPLGRVADSPLECAGARRTARLLRREQAEQQSRRPAIRRFYAREPLRSESWRHPRTRDRTRAHERRYIRRAPALELGPARAHCRSAALVAGREGKLSLPHGFGGESERLGDVLPLQVGIQREDLLDTHAVRNHVHDHRDRNAQPTNTRDSAHLLGSNGDSREAHGARLARSRLHCFVPLHPRSASNTQPRGYVSAWDSSTPSLLPHARKTILLPG